MAKIVSKKIKWEASTSPDVAGYKVYWTTGSVLHYNDACKDVGNNTLVLVPQNIPDFPMTDGNILVGVTAYDEFGNESDMVLLTIPFDFTAPDAPTGLAVEAA
jgi:hypothetical protein